MKQIKGLHSGTQRLEYTRVWATSSIVVVSTELDPGGVHCTVQLSVNGIDQQAPIQGLQFPVCFVMHTNCFAGEMRPHPGIRMAMMRVTTQYEPASYTESVLEGSYDKAGYHFYDETTLEALECPNRLWTGVPSGCFGLDNSSQSVV